MLIRVPVMLSLLVPLAAAAGTAQSETDLARTVVAEPLGLKADSVFRSLERQGFSGVALLARNGSVLLQKGYGLANRRAGIPMTPSTVLQIGSNTKDFTAVAILQLYERGKLGLTDSIGKFFPGTPDDKRGITIQELLNHRSGLVNNVGEDFEPVGRDELIRRALTSPLQSSPGTREVYSNLGFNLLAAIVEIVSGQAFEAYLHDNIMVPLHLHDTGLVLPHFAAERIAHGYSGDEDRGTMIMKAHAADGSWWNLQGAGGLLSTVPEMYRFMTALFANDDPMLKAATRDLRFNPRQAMVLAGSDLVNYFFFDHEPMSGLDIMVASNATHINAERALDSLKLALGLTPPGGRRIARAGSPVATAAGTPFEIPDTPAGHAARSYLRAFNTGDPNVMRGFFADSMAPDQGNNGPTLAQRVERYRGMHDDLGALTPVAATTSEPYQLVLQLRPAGGDALVIITFNVEEAAPHRLRSLRVEVN